MTLEDYLEMRRRGLSWDFGFLKFLNTIFARVSIGANSSTVCFNSERMQFTVSSALLNFLCDSVPSSIS